MTTAFDSRTKQYLHSPSLVAVLLALRIGSHASSAGDIQKYVKAGYM